MKYKQLLIILAFCLTASVAIAQDGYVETPAPAQDNPVSTVDETDDVKEFAITPSLSILNFPHPLNLGLELVFGEFVGIKYGQSLRPSVTIDGDKLKLDDKQATVRLYPTRSAWFIGMAYGQHEAEANRHDVVNGFDTNIFAKVKSEYWMPTTGFKWVYDSGFTIGVEIGWIFPHNSSSRVYSDQDLNPIVNADDTYREIRRDTEEAAEKYVKDGVPTLGLLEIGWTF